MIQKSWECLWESTNLPAQRLRCNGGINCDIYFMPKSCCNPDAKFAWDFCCFNRCKLFLFSWVIDPGTSKKGVLTIMNNIASKHSKAKRDCLWIREALYSQLQALKNVSGCWINKKECTARCFSLCLLIGAAYEIGDWQKLFIMSTRSKRNEVKKSCNPFLVAACTCLIRRYNNPSSKMFAFN